MKRKAAITRAVAAAGAVSRVGKRGIHLAVWALEHGFEAPGLTVISEQDVLGDRLIRQTRKKK